MAYKPLFSTERVGERERKKERGTPGGAKREETKRGGDDWSGIMIPTRIGFQWGEKKKSRKFPSCCPFFLTSRSFYLSLFIWSVSCKIELLRKRGHNGLRNDLLPYRRDNIKGHTERGVHLIMSKDEYLNKKREAEEEQRTDNVMSQVKTKASDLRVWSRHVKLGWPQQQKEEGDFPWGIVPFV